MNALRIALALVVAATATVATAQAPATPNYVQARAGLFMPQSDDLDALEMNTGFGFDVVYGHKFNPNVALELGIGWYKSTSDEFDFGDGTTMEMSVSMMPITASAKFMLPLSQVEPYALVGLGIYRTTFGAELSGFGSGDETSSALGLQLGGGLAFRISPTSTFGVDLRYVTAEPEFDDGEGGEMGLDVSGMLVNAAFAFSF